MSVDPALPRNAAVYELECRLRQSVSDIETYTSSLADAIETEKRAHAEVEQRKTTLNAEVQRRVDYEDALRRLRG